MPSTLPNATTTDDVTLPDGRTLAYAVAGPPDGTPVLVHHGTPGSRLFAALLSGAAHDVGVRLVAPDRPGYGRSGPPPTGWTWDDWRADCEELLAAVATGGAGTLGFSGGGPFALAAAAGDRIDRAALVSTAVPPVDNHLTTLARVPVALRAVFRLAEVVARLSGPGAVVGQYTDRDVDDRDAAAVAADFHEALRRSARAPARENRLFAARPVDLPDRSTPVRAWHGSHDGNAPLDAVRALVDRLDGRLERHDADHLGTLLDCRRDALSWLADGEA